MQLVSFKSRKDGKPTRHFTIFPVDGLGCGRREPDEGEPGVIRVNMQLASSTMALSLTESEASLLVTMLEYAIAGADSAEELPQ
jgi:hypothetical protein